MNNKASPPIPRSLIIITLAASPFVVFWREALGQQVFYHGDLSYYYYPYHQLAVTMTQAGHLPLWNPYVLSGLPFLADIQLGLFYPPTWLFWLAPPAHAMTLIILLHFSLAGVGMFLYARRLVDSDFIAALTAFIFMFNGFLVVRVVHVMIMMGAVYIPWLFWSLDRHLERRRVITLLVLAGLTGLQGLAGHVQIPIYTAIALGLYLLVLVVQAIRRTGSMRPAWPFVDLAAAYVIGLGMSAIQVAPWLELAPYSLRGGGVSFEYVTSYSYRSYDWLLFLFPYGYGGLQTSTLQALPGVSFHPYLWERLAYAGLLPLVLAALGAVDFFQRRTRVASPTAIKLASISRADRRPALLVVLVVMTLIAAGSSTLLARVLYAIPLLNTMRAPTRAAGVAVFALAALAAYGLARLRDHRSAQRSDWVAVAVGGLPLAVILTVLLGTNVVGPAAFPGLEPIYWYRVMVGEALRQPQMNALWPLGLAGAVAVFMWLSRDDWRPEHSAFCALLIAIDLLGFALTFNPTTDPALFGRTPPSVEFLQRDPTPFRTATYLEGDFPELRRAQNLVAMSWGLPYHLEEINGFNPLQTRRYTDLLFGTEAQEASYGFLPRALIQDPQAHLLRLLNVKYLLLEPQSAVKPPPEWPQVFSDQGVVIHQVPPGPGRAYFVAQVGVETDPRLLLARVKSPAFEPTRQAWIEDNLTPDDLAKLSRAGPAQVSLERPSPREIRLRTETSSDRFLVLSEMWLPGWQAEIVGPDGQALAPLAVYRANYLFRGLIVPAGQHTIQLVYRPRSVWLGILVTALTFVGAATALALSKRSV